MTADAFSCSTRNLPSALVTQLLVLPSVSVARSRKSNVLPVTSCTSTDVWVGEPRGTAIQVPLLFFIFWSSYEATPDSSAASGHETRTKALEVEHLRSEDAGHRRLDRWRSRIANCAALRSRPADVAEYRQGQRPRIVDHLAVGELMGHQRVLAIPPWNVASSRCELLEPPLHVEGE